MSEGLPDIWLNQKDLAEFLKVSVGTIRTYVREGVISGASSKRGYNLRDVVIARDEYRKRTARQGGNEKPAKLDPLEQVKVDIEAEKLQKLRTENAKARRELAPTAVLETYAAMLGATVHDGLESLVGSLKKRLPHLRASEMTMIRQEVAKTSNAIADFNPDHKGAA